MGLRIAMEVNAGLVPNQILPEFRKQFFIQSEVWYKEGDWKDKPEEAELEIMKVYGTAQEYMRTLWNPSRVNWVRCDWIYY